MSESVYILGGGRTDFKRNLKKEGGTVSPGAAQISCSI